MEDDPDVAKTLSLVLSIERYRVETVGDGETALAKCKSDVGYDLIITDFLMPGMDGLELARLIKERSPHTPVVLFTAYLEALSSNEKGRLQNIDALLGKPFSLEQLHEALRRVFRQSEHC